MTKKHSIHVPKRGLTVDIVKAIQVKFNTFGGGQSSEWNPISQALKEYPATFAAGVGVSDVVKEVLRLARLNP